MPAPLRHALGAMTGTSLDALDAALVAIEGAGLDIRARVLRCASAPLADLAPRLRALAEGEPHTAARVARLALDFAVFHADHLARLVRDAGVTPDLAALHGQTVHHAPPASWQLLNPWPVARALACPVVYDLRAADLAASGQGAPITPIADWVLFRDRTAREARAVVNLGGFCNITLLPASAGPDGVRGRDVCACNQVLDAVARRALQRPFDQDGAAALSGNPEERAVRELESALDSQSRAGRSLGSGDELRAWIEAHATRLAPADLAASAARAVGATIGRTVRDAGRVVLAGGGVRNRALVLAIEQACARPPEPSDALAVPASHREAVCMAVLGALCADGVPITLPAVTGVLRPAPVAGAWINRPMTHP